ncbi:MAG: threonine synthase [Candidatus Marinimicrobia bacterium]|nr:threonine synthase [Candidatus Neomarinimicrobiota bacterium]|tara:strand:+ start:2920 stop:4203 length:1284 start_codon:yes stop_codon:yes gene_type:complete
MKYFSTNLNTEPVNFKEALFKGLASDGGLFMPENIPYLSKEFFKEKMTYSELATEMIYPFIGEEIDKLSLNEICKSAFNFSVPVVNIHSNLSVLELFHGPTLAFKDFAARFMARLMQYFMQNKNEERTIIVATSGDTGSAVANGFYKLAGINVIILYPSGRVSKIQEQQLTTLGENIKAVEIEGSFDDCQKIVKKAFLDYEIKEKINLSSANSINIARLLPQTVYYAWAWKYLECPKDVIISVPSGNFGNLTGGLFAKRMGLPITKLLASVNSNDIFPNYLNNGFFQSKESVSTLSNAMDVGNPSNFARIQSLYCSEINEIRKDIISTSVSDKLTIKSLLEIKQKYNYLADPHTAVGLYGIKKNILKSQMGVVLSTAHHGKFADIIEPIINKKIKLPKQLREALKLPKDSMKIKNKYNDFKSILLDY